MTHSHPSRQAYQILHLGFTVLPLLAGLDKFFEVLADWDRYLAPLFPEVLGVSSATFMSIVGVIEIVAGLVVFFKPRLGGYLVMLWLWGIILNLLLIPGYYDIALRDFGLSLGALSLARLAVASEATARMPARMREARV
ncbi:MAG TPA: hypothetical protein VKM72_32715 [Thermoanaerobaculia bacterium]|nr:hypothetical protein [Thermoanaerobaculia bacterium]